MEVVVGMNVRFTRDLPIADRPPGRRTRAYVREPESAAGCTVTIAMGTLGVVREFATRQPYARSLMLGNPVAVALIDGTVVEVSSEHLEEASAIDRLGLLADPLSDL